MEVFGGNFIEIVIGGAPFNPEVEAFLRKIIAESFAVIRPRVIACVPLIVEKIFKKNILPFSIVFFHKDSFYLDEKQRYYLWKLEQL